MNVKLKLISSIFSLFLTIFLLLTVVYAWYVSNSEATVSGISCSTYGEVIDSAILTKYEAEETNTTNTSCYTLGNIITSDSSLPVYDDTLGYKKVIYKFSITVKRESNIEIVMRLNDTSRTNIINEDASGSFYNYLSNVASFYKLTGDKTGFTSNTTSINFNYYDSNSTINDMKLEQINFSENNLTIDIYYLFYFNKNNINQLFTDNIGVSYGNSKLFFLNDITFYVKEVK